MSIVATIMPALSALWTESDGDVSADDAHATLTWSDEAWDIQDFERMESVLLSLPDVTTTVTPEILTVLLADAGWQLVIEGAVHIQTFCQTENPFLVPHRWELHELVRSIEVPRVLPMRGHATLMVRHEREVGLEDMRSMWNTSASKVYRLRKEFRHMIKAGNGLSYALVVEKSLHGSGEALQSTDLLSSQSATVQAQVRLGGARSAAKDADRALGQHALRLAAIVRNDPLLMTVDQHAQVLAAYGRLVARTKRAPRSPDARFYEPFFLAPKPVTLEQVHLIDPATRFGAVTIQADYAVTDKADGERMLMYVHTDGNAYLINSALQVVSTGVQVRSANLHNTLIDGEYLPAHTLKYPGQRNIFAAFDIYFINGSSTLNMPLFGGEGREAREGRYDVLKSIFGELGNWNTAQSNLQLLCKTHRRAQGAEMFVAAREALVEAERSPYHNDGLIFTPTKLFVWGVYPNGRTVNVTPEMTGWDRVLKWKPADQNSIDFLVRDTGIEKRHPLDASKRLRQFQLFCGYNVAKNTAISVRSGLELLHDAAARTDHQTKMKIYMEHPFEPFSYYEPDVDKAWFEVGDAGADAFTLDGERIESDTIVECRYDVDARDVPAPLRWRAMRLRKDKTRLYRTNRAIGRAANDMKTARNIWVSMHEPVTRAMITGDAAIPLLEWTAKESSAEERYYARDIPRYHLLSVNMQNFHNIVIKNQLFERPPVAQRRRLLELACGQAGDLPRWMSAGYRYVMGVDYNKNNIEDVANGAYARVLRSMGEASPTAVFLVGDCGKSLRDGSAFDHSPESAEVWRDVTRRDVSAAGLAPIKAFHEGVCDKGRLQFDVVSCQFALHYFLRSAATLDGFLQNVTEHLVEGGYFLATFMDGETVHRQLARAPQGPLLKGVVGGTVIWAVQGQYTGFSQSTEDVYGKEIGVYLENTRQTIVEFLVPMTVLEAKAAAHGLVLEATELFHQTYERESRQHTSRDDPLFSIFQRLRHEHAQRAFSGLNRWVVFRKGLAGTKKGKK